MKRMQHNASNTTGGTESAAAGSHSVRVRLVLLIAAALLLVVAAYAAMGFLWAPAAVERSLARLVVAATLPDLSIGHVRVDPFRRVVVLEEVRLGDPDAAEGLVMKRVEYRLQVRSLLGARHVLDWLVVEQPRMTLAAGRPAGIAEPMPTRILAALIEAEPFRVERLQVADGEIRVHRHDAAGEHVAVYGGISLAAHAIDSGEASPPARYLLEIAEARGARLTLDGAFRMRSATSRQPALEVLSSRGEAQALRLPVLPGLQLTTPVMDIEDFVGTLGTAGWRPEAAARIRMSEALLRDEAGVALALSRLEGRLDVGSTADGDIELQLRGGSRIADRFSLSSRYATAAAWPVTTVTLHDVAAEPLSRMLEALVGRRVSAGLATIALRGGGDAAGSSETSTLEVLASNLAWVPAPQAGVLEPEAGSLETAMDAELLLALLEDPRGEARLAVPVAMRAGTPVSLAVNQAVREYAREAVAFPAAALGRALGLPGAPPMAVRFEPGAAALTPAATETLSELADALSLRPRLGVAVPARIDPQLDRDALARQQVELHVTLATARSAFRARPQPVDFASARAQDVLDEFAGERLAADELAAISAQHERTGPPEARAPYYRAVFAALVDRERIERAALERIGRFRAQSIAEALASAGLATERVALIEGVDIQEGQKADGDTGVLISVQLHPR